MTEKIAVIGSREGANLTDVKNFMMMLYEKYPDSIVLSGGAPGVDTIAEQTWLACGGRVKSYRPTAKEFEPKMPGGVQAVHVKSWAIEVWELGIDKPMVYPLADFPTFENYKSAALARDTLINEEADRIVSFTRKGGSRGAGFTIDWRQDVDGKPRYVYES